ncbi:MAG: CoA transferase, partial [Streptosporangiaceae bacterium]
MDAPLADVRVLEVASHVFVPMAGSVLREWGAEVIKIEDPESGDPYRGLSTFGLHNVYRGVDPFFQSAPRRSSSTATCRCRWRPGAWSPRGTAGATGSSWSSPARACTR